MKNLSKRSQVKSNKKKVWRILNEAWKIQSLGLRKEGKCVGCGSKKNLVAGHLVHGGRGKAWNIVDFNVFIPCQNVFCQCSYCNTYDPDGNGKLRQYFNSIYDNSDILYDKLRELKQEIWKPDEETSKLILLHTERKYIIQEVPF